MSALSASSCRRGRSAKSIRGARGSESVKLEPSPTYAFDMTFRPIDWANPAIDNPSNTPERLVRRGHLTNARDLCVIR